MATVSGKIVTFYSYKGGTGRSMALANTACVLARFHQKAVLMIDWDLEAPGLDRYFSGHFVQDGEVLGDIAVDAHPGLIDLFQEVWTQVETGTLDSIILTDEEAEATVTALDLSRYVLSTDITNLSLIKAGTSDQKYSSLVNSFQWETFYRRAPSLIRAFAQRLSLEYEYILIDSRTGLTDISGICTMLMPDLLVAVFTPNRQSLFGVLELVRKASEYRSRADDLRPLSIFPLPSRVEATEPELKESWRLGDDNTRIPGYQSRFERLFERIYGIKRCDLHHYFDDVQIQHVPRYAYGEEIAVLTEKSADRLSLSRSYEAFADRILSGALPWESSTTLEEATKDVRSVISERKREIRQDTMLQVEHAFSPDYEYDVFVSYAHADNEVPEGSLAQYGWVTTLAHNLNVGPNVSRKKLFIDHHLRQGDDFSGDLVAKVQNSALLMLLLSQNYINSEWCGKELEHFIRSHGNDPYKPRDVFVVELFPYDSLTNIPPNIASLRKQLIHTKFWDYPLGSPPPRLAGYPSPTESGMAQHYWRSIIVLTSAIDTRLRQLRAHHEPEVGSASTDKVGSKYGGTHGSGGGIKD
jgi:cellulose biosynthesis protein BcsQ